MAPRAVKLYGTEVVGEPTRTLKAGLLSVEFESGALRYVRIGGTEVIRAIAFLVRDENWGTFTPSINQLEIDEGPDLFSVTYRAECGNRQRRLIYNARIEGKKDGSLTFEAVAEPETDFVTNRTGFIVLHPLEGVAGKRVRVLHIDAGQEDSTFPKRSIPCAGSRAHGRLPLLRRRRALVGRKSPSKSFCGASQGTGAAEVPT